jgi:hypothetical protein
LAQADKALLTGTFDLTDGVIQRAAFWGKELRTDEWRALKKAFESPKKWSDADLRSALREAGAKYGPTDQAAFERQLPLDRLEPIVGRITTKDVRFDWGTRSEDVDLPDDILAMWVVDLKTSRDQKSECYRLTFDPLTGRMTSFNLRGCQ